MQCSLPNLHDVDFNPLCFASLKIIDRRVIVLKCDSCQSVIFFTDASRTSDIRREINNIHTAVA